MKKLINERENDSEKEKQLKLGGLDNIDATYYMNTTLQCLSNALDLTKYFMEIFVQSENKVMANEYHKVIKNLLDRNSNKK